MKKYIESRIEHWEKKKAKAVSCYRSKQLGISEGSRKGYQYSVQRCDAVLNELRGLLERMEDGTAD